jgi:hypothetical protein
MAFLVLTLGSTSKALADLNLEFITASFMLSNERSTAPKYNRPPLSGRNEPKIEPSLKNSSHTDLEAMTKRREDALALAQLAYDIFTEKQRNAKIDNKQDNEDQLGFG